MRQKIHIMFILLLLGQSLLRLEELHPTLSKLPNFVHLSQRPTRCNCCFPIDFLINWLESKFVFFIFCLLNQPLFLHVGNVWLVNVGLSYSDLSQVGGINSFKTFLGSHSSEFTHCVEIEVLGLCSFKRITFILDCFGFGF